MEQFADRLTYHLLICGYIDTDQAEWCHYAILHQTMNVLSFCMLVLVGSCLVDWRAAVLFTLSFRFLRERTGGYHAKTPHGCLMASLCVQFASLTVVLYVPSRLFFGVIAVFSLCTILKLAPSNNAFIHLTQDEINALRPAIRLRAISILVCACFCLLLSDTIWGDCLIAGMTADAVLLFLSACGLGVQ